MGRRRSSQASRRDIRKTPKPATSLDVAAIADVNNLAVVYDLMRRENGQAPGPDGMRFPHVGRRELYGILRRASQALLKETYRPGPAREVKIPKAGNRGFRTLTLRNVIDRVIAKAVTEAMVPHLEKIFLDGSHGFRPVRSNWTLLAHLEKAVVEQDRWVLVSDDVRSAFPSVNIDLAVADYSLLLGDTALLALVESILRGGHTHRKFGLDQGCPYMPAALNLHLHHAYDVHAHGLGIDQAVPLPWFRYADNLVAACRDISEGQTVLAGMAGRLASVGLALKGENDSRPVDLRQGRSVQLLGFTLFRWQRRLGIKLGDGAFGNLKRNLLNAHQAKRPADAASAAIEGWINSYGPAFRSRQTRTVEHILHLARTFGFRETASEDYYLSLCTGAYQRWRGGWLDVR